MDNNDVLVIMEVFGQSGLAEIHYKNGDSELTLKKYSDAPVHYASPPAGPPPVAAQQMPSPGSAPATATTQAGTTINAPIVGNFYRSPAPDAPSYVEEGVDVKAGDVICIIEAMKNMNQLEAEFDCKIVKILVANGTLVEFGTPLFEVIKK